MKYGKMKATMTIVFMIIALMVSGVGFASATPLISGDTTETCRKGLLAAAPTPIPCSVQTINPHPAWQPNNPGASPAVWISYDDTGTPGAVSPPNSPTFPIMTITEAFYANTGTTLSLKAWGDDKVEVWIDAVLQIPVGNFTIGSEAVINYTFGAPGLHKVEFRVFQLGGGPTGLLYAGEYTEPTDHYRCYTIFPPKTLNKFVKLKDQFRENKSRVIRSRLLCAPVSKNGEPVSDLNGIHLEAYQINEPPLENPKPNVKLDNQFGTEITTIYKPEFLLVPTKKEVISPCGGNPTTC